MLGKHESQTDLFDVGNVFPFELDPKSFQGQLAKVGPDLFRDEDFAAFYSEKNGRPSVPPSLLVLTMIMQAQANISDREAIARTACDLRWAAVLRRHAGEPLCVRSTLELFRSHLIIHGEAARILKASIQQAARKGLLKTKELRVAVDTKPMECRGAVEDTCNLLAGGIRQLARALAKHEGQQPQRWMKEHGLARYTEPSIKGAADIDWSDRSAIDSFVAEIVADARRLLPMIADTDDKVRQAAELLSKLLLQDIEETASESGESQTHI